MDAAHWISCKPSILVPPAPVMAFRPLQFTKSIHVLNVPLTNLPLFSHQRKSAHERQYEPIQRTYSKQALSYYEILGITPKASHSQIKASYYKLSKEYHPDVNKTSEAKLKFSAISEAYEVLGNKVKRSDYDRQMTGHSGFSGFTGGNTDVEYQEFLRKQGAFKQRGNVPTGRTKIYNFDEFYKAHYGDAIKQKQASNKAKIQYDEEVLHRSQKNRKVLLLYVGLMATLVFLGLRRK